MSLYFTEGELNPALYQPHDNNITVGTNKKLGQLNFSLKYNSKSHKLTIVLFCGKDYPARDFSGSVDTCVTVCLLPDRELRKQTAIHRRSTNPTYSENFVFNITYNEDVYSHSVLFVVFYYDQMSHSKVLGEAQVPLVEFDLSTETMVWCYLQEGSVRRIFIITDGEEERKRTANTRPLIRNSTCASHKQISRAVLESARAIFHECARGLCNDTRTWMCGCKFSS